MAPQPDPPPPPPPAPVFVIKRKKAGHAAHHGGAWKVAYADFVTAMMALFMVLWLMGADDKVKEAISAFFNNPTGLGNQKGTTVAGSGNSIELAKDDMAKLREKMEQALRTMPNFRDMKDQVEMTITSDGLRIELLETQAGMFFESGKALPTATGAELLTRLAEELGKMPNNLQIEGHTDAKPFVTDEYYSNWELATDRANAARRLMEAHGVRSDQVAQVRGFAARQLRHPEDPENPSNRRISLIVQYLTPPASPARAAGEAAKTAGEAPKGGGDSPPKAAGEPAKAPLAPAEALPPPATTPAAPPKAPPHQVSGH